MLSAFITRKFLIATSAKLLFFTQTLTLSFILGSHSWKSPPESAILQWSISNPSSTAWDWSTQTAAEVEDSIKGQQKTRGQLMERKLVSSVVLAPSAMKGKFRMLSGEEIFLS